MASASSVQSYFAYLLQNPRLAPGEYMKFEAARLQSFAYWMSYDRASPIYLAKAGFFYTGDRDHVKCYVCHIIRGNWNKTMNPMLIHRELSKECSFCLSVDRMNVPIFVPEPTLYEEILQNLHSKYCGSDAPVLNRGISHRSLDNPDHSNDSNRLNQTQTNFPVVATDAAAPETSRQVIEVQGALGRGHDSEAAPTREEFAPMKQESNRFSSFDSTWPTRHGTPDPRDLSRAGFYYTGRVDRVQCAFCRGILRNWDENDVPMETHRRHFPMCPFVMGLDVGNIPDPTAIIAASREVFSVTQPSAVVSDASLGIVTERPKHAQYAVEAARITSFRNWPSGKEQTPETLAKAGFFYAGIGVKCFFCDGGLRTWERGDLPWTEHARWYPSCPYVRQVKGEDFIQSARQEHESSTSDREVRGIAQSSQSLNGKSHTDDPRELSARMDSTVVQSVLSLDFPWEMVTMAIKNRLQATGDDFPSVAELVDAIYKLAEKAPQKPTAASSSTRSPKNYHGAKGKNTEDVVMSDDDDESQSLMKENKDLKKQRRCKVCMDADVSVVFLPCGHLVCCASCAPAMRKCPICRNAVKGNVRTYMS